MRKQSAANCHTANCVIDGRVIPATFWDDFMNGSAKDIKLLIGSTNGEEDWIAFDYENYPAALDDPALVWERIEEHFYDQGLDTKYMLNPIGRENVIEKFLILGDDKVQRMADLRNNFAYVQGTEYVAEAQSKWNDTFLYYWTYAPKPQSIVDYMGDAAEFSPFGRAMHSMDLLFSLGNVEDGYLELSGDPALLPESLDEMAMVTWYAFAKTGDPNNAMIPTWETYDTTERQTMVMDAEWTLVSDPRKEDREILSAIRPQGEK